MLCPQWKHCPHCFRCMQSPLSSLFPRIDARFTCKFPCQRLILTLTYCLSRPCHGQGLRRTSNLGGCKLSTQRIKEIWGAVRKITRVSHYSLRIVARMTQIAAQQKRLHLSPATPFSTLVIMGKVLCVR